MAWVEFQDKRNADKLRKAQVELRSLRQENAALAATSQSLRSEIAQLTEHGIQSEKECMRLRTELEVLDLRVELLMSTIELMRQATDTATAEQTARRVRAIDGGTNDM